MCAPKPPKVERVPERQAARLPDQGDPAVREGVRRRRFATRAMILPTLGAPSVSTLGAP
jgi:hypothetical protein